MINNVTDEFEHQPGPYYYAWIPTLTGKIRFCDASTNDYCWVTDSGKDKSACSSRRQIRIFITSTHKDEGLIIRVLRDLKLKYRSATDNFLFKALHNIFLPNSGEMRTRHSYFLVKLNFREEDFHHVGPVFGEWLMISGAEARKTVLKKMSSENWDAIWNLTNNQQYFCLASGSALIYRSAFIKIKVKASPETLNIKDTSGTGKPLDSEECATRFYLAIKNVFHTHMHHSDMADGYLKIYEEKSSLWCDPPQPYQFERIRMRLSRIIIRLLESAETKDKIVAAAGFVAYLNGLTASKCLQLSSSSSGTTSPSSYTTSSLPTTTTPVGSCIASTSTDFDNYSQKSIDRALETASLTIEKKASLRITSITVIVAFIGLTFSLTNTLSYSGHVALVNTINSYFDDVLASSIKHLGINISKEFLLLTVWLFALVTCCHIVHILVRRFVTFSQFSPGCDSLIRFLTQVILKFRLKKH